MALCTQLQVEQRLGTTYADAGDIASIAELIAAAQGHIERVVGHELENGSHTETFDAPSGPLWLKHTPITAITSVTVDGTALTSGQYTFAPLEGRLDRTTSSRPASWGTSKLQTVVVVYDGGYTTIPYDLQDICAWAAARAFQTNLTLASVPAGAEGIKQVLLAGSDSVTYKDVEQSTGTLVSFTEQEHMALSYYRNQNVL